MVFRPASRKMSSFAKRGVSFSLPVLLSKLQDHLNGCNVVNLIFFFCQDIIYTIKTIIIIIINLLFFISLKAVAWVYNKSVTITYPFTALKWKK